RRARARHVGRPGGAQDRPAPGDRAHSAGLRLDPVSDHQGYGDRDGDRGPRADAPVRDDRGPELSAARSVHHHHAGVLLPAVSGHPRGRRGLPAHRASGPLMKLDWSVAWQYREALAHGVLITVLLTVLTMAIAVPGGIAVMLLRQSRLALVRGLG